MCIGMQAKKVCYGNIHAIQKVSILFQQQLPTPGEIASFLVSNSAAHHTTAAVVLVTS
jgi:hypothetical protein